MVTLIHPSMTRRKIPFFEQRFKAAATRGRLTFPDICFLLSAFHRKETAPSSVSLWLREVYPSACLIRSDSSDYTKADGDQVYREKLALVHCLTDHHPVQRSRTFFFKERIRPSLLPCVPESRSLPAPADTWPRLSASCLDLYKEHLGC